MKRPRTIVKPETIPTDFGHMIKLPVPNDCDLIIVCTNNGGGLVPVRLLLPHQLYREDLKKLVEQTNAREITIIPARSEEYFDVFRAPGWDYTSNKHGYRIYKRRGK